MTLETATTVYNAHADRIAEICINLLQQDDKFITNFEKLNRLASEKPSQYKTTVFMLNQIIR
jgi:hypothetical protein